MNRVLFSTAAVLALAGAAMARPVYSNGPFVTGIGNGFGGGNTSTIEPDYTSFGTGTNEAALPANGGPVRVADDFTVTGPGWNLNTATFYMYQTVASPATNPLVNTITSIRVGIYNASPSGTDATPDLGDFSTNRLAGAVFTNTFRVTSTTLTDDNRAIFAITADLSDFPDLLPGSYWLAWSTTGSNPSGPWQVPVTPTGAGNGATARQFFDPALTGNGSWADLDGTASLPGIQHVDLAFDLDYTLIPAPSAALAFVGAGLVGLRRRRN